MKQNTIFCPRNNLHVAQTYNSLIQLNFGLFMILLYYTEENRVTPSWLLYSMWLWCIKKFDILAVFTVKISYSFHVHTYIWNANRFISCLEPTKKSPVNLKKAVTKMMSLGCIVYYTPAQRSWRGGILDSPCPSVRLSVRPSVRLSVDDMVSGA